VQSYSSLKAVEGGLADLAAWSLASDKIKLAELAEGGATHPFFLTVLQVREDRSIADPDSGAFF
jgi:hypothetical protein